MVTRSKNASCVFMVLLMVLGHVGCVAQSGIPTAPIEESRPSALATEPSGTEIASHFGYAIQDGEVTILNVLTQAPNVVIPEQIDGYPVTVIGESAFYEKGSCVSVELPASLRRIESGAFYRCYSLMRISIPAGVTFIADDAFFRTSSLERIDVQEGNAAYCTIDGVLFTIDGTILVCYPEGRVAQEYVIPEGVLTIGDSAFGYHPQIKRVKVPNTVTNFPEGPLAAITEDLTIIGEPGSAAEAYASKWEIQLSNPPETIP